MVCVLCFHLTNITLHSIEFDAQQDCLLLKLLMGSVTNNRMLSCGILNCMQSVGMH